MLLVTLHFTQQHLCHSQEKMQIITFCQEKIGEDGQDSTKNHQKASLQ